MDDSEPKKSPHDPRKDKFISAAWDMSKLECERFNQRFGLCELCMFQFGTGINPQIEITWQFHSALHTVWGMIRPLMGRDVRNETDTAITNLREWIIAADRATQNKSQRERVVHNTAIIDGLFKLYYDIYDVKQTISLGMRISKKEDIKKQMKDQLKGYKEEDEK